MNFKLNTKTLLKINYLLLAIFCIVFFSNFEVKNAKAGIEVTTPSQAEANTAPDELYQKVWELIKKDYVDQTYNGQDWDIWKDRYKGKLQTLDDSHKAIETM